MHFKIFLQQLRRGSRRTALYILLLTAVTAFFVMSINLYRNSVTNLEAVEDSYSTIAVMELYGDVDQFGELTDPTDESYAGHKAVSVRGYDFSDVVSADGVIDWDLRAKYAAYIADEVAMLHETFVMADADIIRFRLAGDEPVELPISWEPDGFSSFDLELEVLDSAAGCYKYTRKFTCDGIDLYNEEARYHDQVKRLNRSEEVEKVILYPGVEYVVTTWTSSGWVPSDEPGMFEFADAGTRGVRFYPNELDYGWTDIFVVYGDKSEWYFGAISPEVFQPFPIQRWEDVQSDPELKEYFDAAWEAIKIQTSVFNVALTKDISGVPTYHLGGAYLKEGRAITEEEYESGAKVCMISDVLAGYQGWQVGDKLDMDFFEFDYFPNSNEEWDQNQGLWHRGTEGFFYGDEYEIVGIYAQTPTTGNSGIAKSTLAMAWNTIYIPHNAVENTPPLDEQPVHGALLTIWLENGSIDRFLADVEALGLLEEKEGQYNPSFSFFDQGYSLVQPGLEAMHGTARLLLVLSSVLLAVTCVLLAYFFAQNHRQSVGIFRMLGGTKAKALSAVLACALLVAAAGAGLGALAGYGLTQSAGAKILEGNLAQSSASGAFQAFVLNSDIAKEQALAVQADPALTALGAGAALLVPVALILGFVLLYIHKEPRELLPKGND